MMSESQPAFALRVVYRRCIGERERERERGRYIEILRSCKGWREASMMSESQPSIYELYTEGVQERYRERFPF